MNDTNKENLKKDFEKTNDFRSGLKLSTKLTIVNSIFIFLIFGLLTFGLYLQIRSVQKQAIQDRLYDILNFSAPLIDGDFHSLIRHSEDETSSFYRSISLRLQSIQETSDIIERIYTLRQQEDGSFIYVVDFIHSMGAIYLRSSLLMDKRMTTIQGPIVESSIYTDSTGVFLSGYVPIYDQFDELDGVLGIDINAANIVDNERQARRIAFGIFLIAVPISLLFVIWFARKLTEPVNDLIAGAIRIEKGKFDEPVPVRSRDELSVLAIVFNHMVDRLKHTMRKLEEEIAKLAHAQKLQEATYKIAQAAISSITFDALLNTIHSILGEIIFVENFYIALYDSTTGLVSFPYFIDQYDEQPSTKKIGRGLTDYVLRTGEPLLATPDILASLEQQGKIDLVGMDCMEWLGVPLKNHDQVIGVMGTQSYSKNVRFTLESKEFFEFISVQVAQSIERKRAEETLIKSNERYYRLFEDSPTPFWEVDLSIIKKILDSFWKKNNQDFHVFLETHPDVVVECVQNIRILDVNKSALVLFGAKNKEDLADNLHNIFYDDSYLFFQNILFNIAEKRVEFTEDCMYQTLDGKQIVVSMKWSVLPGSEDDFTRVIISIIDITKQRDFENKLTYQSTHDALTGLYNRSFLDEEFSRVEREQLYPVSIIVADIDNLKETNDLNGHTVGDNLLKVAATTLLASFRAEDIIARFGGDEFVVLLPETNEMATQRAIQRIKDNIQKMNKQRLGPPLNLSIGASTGELDNSLKNVLEQADKNMYLDKQSRK